MAVYLGSTPIEGVITSFATTTFDTQDATATADQIQSGKTAYVKGSKVTGTLNPAPANIKQNVVIAGVTGTYTSDATATAALIQRGYTAYAKGSKLTGTGPKMFYQASAPTSGMSAGDIWVKTATTAPTSGNYSVFTPNTNFSVAFTEDIAYVTYARTMSGVTNFTCNGTKNGTSLSVSYNIYYLLNDPQTTNDYNATFTYKLEFVDTAGTVTSIVSSSKSVAHGASGNVTATVSKTVADLDGYFRLTYTMSLPHMMGEDNSGNDDGSGSPAKATGTIRSANLFSGGPSTSGAYWTELWYYTSNGWRR